MRNGAPTIPTSCSTPAPSPLTPLSLALSPLAAGRVLLLLRVTRWLLRPLAGRGGRGVAVRVLTAAAVVVLLTAATAEACEKA